MSNGRRAENAETKGRDRPAHEQHRGLGTQAASPPPQSRGKARHEAGPLGASAGGGREERCLRTACSEPPWPRQPGPPVSSAARQPPASSAAASPAAFPSSTRQVVLLCPNAPATTRHPPLSSLRPHPLPPRLERASHSPTTGPLHTLFRCRKPPPRHVLMATAGFPRVSNPPPPL